MNRLSILGGALGCLLGLALVKFGNPIIFDRLIDPPRDIWEFLFQPWPVSWGYPLLVGCVLLALGTIRLKPISPRWVWALPCLWCGWQLFSAISTIEPKLTGPTLVHFAACLCCYALGLFGLANLKRADLFWTVLLAAFAFVLWAGFEQHYGGLDATRKMFYAQPNWQQASPDYIKKIESNRVFSTLVYPNALAAAILLLLPSLLVSTWRLTRRLTDPSRAVLVGVLAYAAFACLYWSGSKSGWLIALVLILVAALRQPFSRVIKLAILGAVLAGGLTAFYVKYGAYFRKGAPSVSARFQYWTAAVSATRDHPLFGTGPGTFSVAYRQRRPPEAEMAQLVHNDYLEQASDSGIPGALLYAGFVLGSILVLPRRRPVFQRDDLFALWLGLLGWSLQSFVEFPLYIPALAWTAFALFGWLWGEPAAPEIKVTPI